MPVEILDLTYGVAVGNCTTVETSGASMGGFSSAPAESASISDITCKIYRYKQS